MTKKEKKVILEDAHKKCTSPNAQCQFSERFLQIIWNEKILSSNLRCTDGTILRIVSSGTWNVSFGPDFSNAVLLFDSELHRGAIEIHRFSSDWFRHGHQNDNSYNEVILHVVWQDDLLGEKFPDHIKTLEICQHLPSAWQSLFAGIEEAFYPYSSCIPPGTCSLQWALLDNEKVSEVLYSAAEARFSAKAEQFRHISAQSGFSQALYQEFFAGLGFANNRTPFRELALHCSLDLLSSFSDLEKRRAILFGFAGFLADPTRDPVQVAFRPILLRYWQLWWESGFKPLSLIWKSSGSRPFNSCHRRLQSGILWLEKINYDPDSWLQNVIKQATSVKDLHKLLLDYPSGDALWRKSKDFCSPLRVAGVLLGKARAKDLALNILLPAAYSREEQERGESSPKAKLIKDAWLQLSPGQENHLLKEAIHRFLIPPSRAKEILKKAALQQGLIDIYQKFCLALGYDCPNCPFVIVGE